VRTAPRKSLLVNLGWMTALLLVVAVGYSLSYAPAYRWKYGADTAGALGIPIDPEMPVFRPVEWMIDKSPLRSMLLAWSDVWGVGSSFRRDTELRVRVDPRSAGP
jgi:hypothetical protein